MDYAQGLVQLLLLIFTSMISFFALFIFMKDGKAVNYNGSEIIGLINLKYKKRMACRDNVFTLKAWMRDFPKKQGKGQQQGINTIILNLNKLHYFFTERFI